MKKLITLLLVLTGMVCTAKADTTVYINLSAGNWGGANLKLYTYGDSNGAKWHDFTNVVGNIYVTTYSESPTNVIVVRKNSTDSDDNFSNVWNQTSNLTAPSASAVCYVFSSSSSFEPQTTTLPSEYSSTNFWISSEQDIAPSYKGWTKDEDTKMTNNGDFTYTLEVTGNILDADTYGYKVRNDNGDWLSDPDNLWPNPSGNYGVTCPEAGTYTITYTYNVLTERATTELTKTGTTTAT